MTTKSSKNIYQKKNSVMKKIEKLAKDLEVDYKNTHYKGVSEAEVLSHVRPILLEEGIDISIINAEQFISGDSNRMRVKYTIRWTNIDDPADFIDTVSIGDGQDYGDKAPGKATTYALKYNIMKNLLLVSGDDPDLESSEELLDKMEAEKNKSSQKRVVSKAEGITDKEIDELLELSSINNIDSRVFARYLKVVFGMKGGKLPAKVRTLVKDEELLDKYFKKAVASGIKEELNYDPSIFKDLLLLWGKTL